MKKALSFEFFPPKTEEAQEKLRHTRKQLRQFQPEFFSCTFGAGGTTKDGTLNTVMEIMTEGTPAAPHLSCIGATYEGIAEILEEYKSHGIRHIVALRGDIPSGMVSLGDFRYASELVAFIREKHGDWFHIEVAAYPEYHPQAKNAQDDINNFVTKVKAGANSAITQYFFNADAYFAFVDEVQAKGVNIPIVPGILPITSSSQLVRFSDMCGAEVPRWLKLKLQSYGDDIASIKALGLDVTTALADKLLTQGAPSLHFYTLNQAGTVSTICQRLGY
ncbi:methylenetetrahydrofolate reductase [NAD(P)H] [Neisseria sp. Ec49-e6-T10]|uniref:methylenetetrahydrofolate reductase [NAD(P)H] n=1 Tax=Neisseria sp. Ec49-e6-T10 TaxID=3140744 RepID=UPI003EBA68EB